MMRKLLYSFLLIIFLHTAGFGQSIWSNNIDGNNPGNSNQFTSGQIVTSGITVSGISRTGLTGANGDDRYNASGWDTSLNSGRYFEFILTPSSGYKLSLSSFQYVGIVGGGSNPVSGFAVKSSINNYGSTLATTSSGDITLGAEFQNLTGPVTFRIYAWGASTARTYGIDSFRFNGSVNCIAVTTSNAGPDQNSNTSFTLAANTPSVGTGAWTIVSGPSILASQFSNTSSPTATFTPLGSGTYTLRWTISNSCGTSIDDVVLAANCVSNLIKNGDFSNGASNWSKATTRGSYVEVLTEGIYFGNGSNDNTAELDSEASLRQDLTVVPGVSYTLSFLYARRPGSPASVAVDARIFGGSTASINYTTSNTTSIPMVGNLTFTPSSSSIGIEFYNSLGTTTLGSIIDNIVLIPTSQVAPIAVTSPKGNFKTLKACAGVPVRLDVENVTAPDVTYAWTSTSPGAVFSSTTIKDPTVTFTGSGIQNATVVVTNAGGCSGIPSTTYVDVQPSATIYAVTGGGAYCSGGTGVVVGLANSTSGVTYQLQLNGVINGPTVAGTGAAISFGSKTAAGTYTVVATNPSVNTCAVNMSGNAVISVDPTSVGGNIAGNTTVCTGTNSTTLTLSGHTGSVTKWQSSPSSTFASSITDISNTTTTLIATNLTSTTYYRAVVTSGTCSAANSAVATITVNPNHTITAGSDRNLCQNTAMTNITMTLGGGATGATVIGLPAGVTNSVSGNTLTISGIPTVSGQFTYNVTTTGNSCTAATTTGIITVGIGNNIITYANGTSGSICVNAAENNATATDFIAPAGTYFNNVSFASYGTANGNCSSFSLNYTCHAPSSQGTVENALLGNSGTIKILPSNSVFPDPCVGTVKSLKVIANYSQAICPGTTAPVIIGSTPTGSGTYTYSWERSTTGLAGSFSPISGTNSKDYFPGILNQSTWFRRIVTSSGCSNTSAVVLVKVNPRPTSIVSGTTTVCNGISTAVSVALTGTAPWNLTYSDGTATTNVTGITASPYTFNVSPTTNTTYTVTALSDANNCPSIASDRTGSAVITLNSRPTATVSGSTTICRGTSATVSVAFTGTAPWNISYTYGATSGNFSTSLNPYTVEVSPTSTTTYSITALSDSNCTALAAGITGNATITVNPLPTAPIVTKNSDATCESLGRVTLTGLPSGSWTINQTGVASQTLTGTTSSRIISGLAAGTYYFTVTNASNCTSSPVVPITIVNQTSTTIWNGSAWSNGDPDSSKTVIINSAANQPFTASIAACSLTINVPTGVGDPNVIIPDGVTLTITNSVTSNGKLVFESGSSLVQTTNAVNTGDIIYRRTTAARRYDFTYWSMPVTKPGFSMYDLSPGTLNDKFQYYDPDAGWSVDLNGKMPMETGRGYNVRAPQSFNLTTPQNFTAVFTGVPNNGDYPVPVASGKWNLIGNPYPSAIDADELMLDNLTLGSLYFWGHEALPVLNPADGKYYYNGDFTVYNSSGATVGGSGLPFQGYIAAAQGFIARPASGTVIFNNDIRLPGSNSQFYKTAKSAGIEKNRVWLNFANTDGVFKQILVGYIQGATNTIDVNYDAVSMGANTFVDFYSINSNKKLTIQGRSLPFEKSDEVPLGYKLSAKGAYTISIDHADGIFDNQDVYLEDKETGKTTNLRLEDYKFTTAEGSFNSRFVIRYTSKTLGTDDFENLQNSVIVSVKDGVVKITSSKEALKEVNIYNVGAQLLYTKTKVNSSELVISNLHSSDQALLVKITLENGHTFTKKIIYSNL